MSILKAKFIFTSLVAAITLSLVMTSCEQEELLPIEPTITEKTNTTETSKAVPNDEELYIVMFKTDANKKNARAEQLKSLTSRKDVSETTKRMGNDFKQEVATITKKLNVSSEKVRDYYAFFDGVSMTLTAQEAKALKNNPLIESIEADREINVELPKPEKLNTQSPINNSSQSDYYGWFNYNHGGYRLGGSNKSTWIWIIDTGIDLNHPDLNVITNSSYARSFVGGTPDDCQGHGTHVAGIAAARKNNIGMVGMSEGAWVVPVKILDCNGNVGGGYSTFTSILIAGLNHVYAGSISGDVVNMSVREYGAISGSLVGALGALNNRGVYMAMAAGNEARHASQCYPANYNNTRAKTVASMDYNSVFSSFSNYGIAPIDYIATGKNVYSTYKNGGYTTLSGTSMATPVVAGIIHARGGLPATSGTVYNRYQWYPKVRL